jgi:hypothetical protein
LLDETVGPYKKAREGHVSDQAINQRESFPELDLIAATAAMKRHGAAVCEFFTARQNGRSAIHSKRNG